ncbi:hypothetical protein [Polaromonas sp.]|jgi:hypothetical protein|uniref:hypothetical protein n=1 Tax=Polaromonas sp. TaxID=1869339 RepID=UPI0037C6633B
MNGASTGRSSVLVSGAGQLGSRYLQGLATCRHPLDIHVHDVQPAALALAEQRWQEVAALSTAHTVSFQAAVAALPREFDVAIVATTARARPQLVREIAEHSAVRYWVLEKVLAQSEAGLDDILACTQPSRGAWVNTPRRMLPWHHQIAEHLVRNGAMTMTVDGGFWGLACNSIHFLDLFSWWTGETLEAVDCAGLADHWIEGKRAGNWEVLGSIEARFSGGSTMRIHAQQGEVFYTFELVDGEQVWRMTEQTGTAVRSDGLEVPGRIPFQSELSGDLVVALLTTGYCGLPSVAQSVAMHRIFIRGLLLHWRQTMDPGASLLPIT